jgi:hypothetical protein
MYEVHIGVRIITVYGEIDAHQRTKKENARYQKKIRTLNKTHHLIFCNEFGIIQTASYAYKYAAYNIGKGV